MGVGRAFAGGGSMVTDRSRTQPNGKRPPPMMRLLAKWSETCETVSSSVTHASAERSNILPPLEGDEPVDLDPTGTHWCCARMGVGKVIPNVSRGPPKARHTGAGPHFNDAQTFRRLVVSFAWAAPENPKKRSSGQARFDSDRPSKQLLWVFGG